MRSYLNSRRLKNRRRPFLLLLLSFALFVPLLSAQTSDQLLQNARNLERANYFEEAFKLYERVYQADPKNMAAIAGIKNCYIGLQKYEDLIGFLEQITRSQTYDSTWQIDLAEAYFLNNEQTRAFDIWQSLLQQRKNDPAVFRLVAAAMIRQRQFNQAIAVYNQAIENIEAQQSLHVDIASIYTAQLNYQKASEHLLLYYFHFPKQFNYVQRQLLSLSDKAGSMQPVIDAVRDFLVLYPEQKPVQELLAGFYIKDQNYPLALTAYKNLENGKTDGTYLFRFSTEALANGAYPYAIDGFELLLNTYPRTPLRLQARFDLGRAYTLAAYANEQKEMSAGQMQQAVAIFNALISDTKAADYNGKSLIQLADIYFSYYFDLDKAIATYLKYLDQNPSGPDHDTVLLRLGDTYLTKNQAGPAIDAYARVRNPQVLPLAVFKTAEVYYYSTQFKKAADVLQNAQTMIKPLDPLMNDILTRKILIERFKKDSLALSFYAEADLLDFQKKYSQAAEAFETLSKSGGRLQSLAGRQAAKIYMRLGKYSEAGALLFYLRNEIPADKDMDEILYLLATSEEKLKNRRSALDLYHQLMLNYPNSLFLQEAREQARRLNDQEKKEQI